MNNFKFQVAIIVFGLVSGGGVTGRSGDVPNALTQSDLTGGGLYLNLIN